MWSSKVVGRARGRSDHGRCRHDAAAQPSAAWAMPRPLERAPASDGADGVGEAAFVFVRVCNRWGCNEPDMVSLDSPRSPSRTTCEGEKPRGMLRKHGQSWLLLGAPNFTTQSKGVLEHTRAYCLLRHRARDPDRGERDRYRDAHAGTRALAYSLQARCGAPSALCNK